jgi:hypothetical protein
MLFKMLLVYTTCPNVSLISGFGFRWQYIWVPLGFEMLVSLSKSRLLENFEYRSESIPLTSGMSVGNPEFTWLCGIYSLGVLFEISLWRPNQKYREADEAKVGEKLLHNTSFLLLGIMGETCARTVENCLKGGFGAGVWANSEDLDRLFWSMVQYR